MELVQQHLLPHLLQLTVWVSTGAGRGCDEGDECDESSGVMSTATMKCAMAAVGKAVGVFWFA